MATPAAMPRERLETRQGETRAARLDAPHASATDPVFLAGDANGCFFQARELKLPAIHGVSVSETSHLSGPVLLSPGTLVLVPTSRVHACNPAPNSAWSYQMLHLDAAWLHAVRREYARTDAMEDEPVRIVTDPVIYARFCRLNALLFGEADPVEKEAALIECVGDYDSGQGRPIERPIVPSNLAEQLRPALNYLCARPTANTTLDKLAVLAGMSRYQAIRAFRAVTSMTPHAWQPRCVVG
ncbi:MAG: AraC family transcriptional regulator, partial [Janthinobacterium lividum]